MIGIGLALGGANLGAERATGAVVGRDLDGEGVVLGRAALEGNALEGLRFAVERAVRVNGGADGGVRADGGAFVALDAERGVPDGDVGSEIALFPSGGAGGPAAVGREGGDGQQVAFAGQHARGDALHEVGREGRDGGGASERVGGGAGDFDGMKGGEGGIDGGPVFLDDGFAFADVGFFNGFLDRVDGDVAGEDVAEGEEAGLHHGVDLAAHAGGAGNGEGVDGEDF